MHAQRKHRHCGAGLTINQLKQKGAANVDKRLLFLCVRVIIKRVHATISRVLHFTLMEQEEVKKKLCT
jgi:hypothetical protein